MSAESISLRVIEILNANQVAYMLVGSLSTNFHSIVRSTKDADLVIQGDLGATAGLIAREYPDLKLDPQYGFKSVTGTTRLLLRAIEEDFVVELFGLSIDPHDQARFLRRIAQDWEGRQAWIATAEDAVITKLRWAEIAARHKDYQDAKNVIAAQQGYLDWLYIESWCDQHGSRLLLEKIRGELKNIY